MLKQIKRVPVPAAILIMILCLLLGVASGNKKALDQAVKRYGVDMSAIMQEANNRATQATNLLTVCRRNLDAGDPAILALEEAIAAQKGAKAPAQLAQANRDLTFAAQTASNLTMEKASEQDKRLTTGVMDEMISAQKILSREAVAYNNGVASVRDVYDGLPTQFLLGKPPEVFQ